jgi:glutaredoxin-related protein
MNLYWLSRNVAIPTVDISDTEIGETPASSAPMIVRDRSSFSNPSKIESEILNRMESAARQFEKGTGKEDIRSQVMVDQVIGLGSPNAVASAIENILDLKGNGENRVAYLCPLFIYDNGVKVKLVLIHPALKNNVRDARRLFQQALDLSLPVIERMVEARKKKPLQVDEKNPGKHLLEKKADGKIGFDPYRVSFEKEFNRYLSKTFETLSLNRVNTDLFERRVMSELASRKQITALTPEYHVVAQEVTIDNKGEFASQPEIISHYRVLADALKTIILPKLKTIAEQKSFTGWVPQADSEDNIQPLIDLVQRFPNEGLTSKPELQFKEQINQVLEVLQKVMTKTEEVAEQKTEKQIRQRVEKYIENIKANSLDPQKRFITSIDFVKETFESDEDRGEVKKDLMNSMGGLSLRNNAEQDIVVFVHPHYFLFVEVQLTRLAELDPKARKRLDLLKKIKQNIVSRPELAAELNKGIPGDQYEELTRLLNMWEGRLQEKLKQEAIDQTYDVTKGFVFSLLHLGISGALWAMIGGFMGGLLFGVSVVSLIFLAKVYAKRSAVNIQKKTEEKQSESVAASDAPVNAEAQAKAIAQKNFYNSVNKKAKDLVVPVRFETLAHRSFTSKDIEKSMKDFYKQIPELKNNKGLAGWEASAEGRKKLTASIDQALLTEHIKIKVPENLFKAGMPEYWYINAADWKTKRTHLSDGFRKMLDDNRTDKLKQEMYKHLVNCVEAPHNPNYRKYIVDRSK